MYKNHKCSVVNNYLLSNSWLERKGIFIKISHKKTKMYLMYYLNEKGERVYTLKKIDPNGKPTLSAHPARFSVEDKYSRERITMKKRFGLLLTQQPLPSF